MTYSPLLKRVLARINEQRASIADGASDAQAASKYAERASKWAHGETATNDEGKEVTGEGNAQEHYEAADAHEEAGNLHSELGNTKIADKHYRESRRHTKIADKM